MTPRLHLSIPPLLLAFAAMTSARAQAPGGVFQKFDPELKSL